MKEERIAHVQLGGMAVYGEGPNFMFMPDEAVEGQVERFRCCGVAQQMSDGTFDFVVRPRLRTRSTLIRKVAHGRLSATADEAIQLTLKVFKSEGLDYRKVFLKEVMEVLG